MRLGLLVLAPLVVAAACGGDDGGEATPDDAGQEEVATVTVATFAFAPDPLEVDAGTTITFVNEDAIDHTVTAGTREAPTPDVFDGSLPEEGSTFDLVLDEPGTYEYFCEIHPGPGMTATITVR
jgi:plastocyanin